MTKRYKNSCRSKVLEYIQTADETVILRADLNPLGEYRQISRAIKALIEDGELIKLGYGVYVKSEKSEYTNRPVIKMGFTNACIEILRRLGIEWEPSKAIQDYNEGKTQQVPINFSVRLKNRYRGELSDGKRTLIFEGMINAQ